MNNLIIQHLGILCIGLGFIILLILFFGELDNGHVFHLDEFLRAFLPLAAVLAFFDLGLFLLRLGAGL